MALECVPGTGRSTVRFAFAKPSWCRQVLFKSLQIHVQLHAAQGAAVARGAAAVAHAAQGGGLKLVFRYFQAEKQVGVLVSFVAA